MRRSMAIQGAGAMRLQTWVAGALLLALQGCAGTPSAFDPGDSAALRSLPLFDAAGGPGSSSN